MGRRVVLVATVFGLAGLAGAGPEPGHPPQPGHLSQLGHPPASAAGPAAGCALTGHVLPPGAASGEAGPAVVEDLWLDSGAVLDRADRWLVPAGQRSVLVVEGGERLGPGRIRTMAAGRVIDERPLREVGEHRMVAEIAPIPSAVRTVGIEIDATICEIALAVAVDRDPWSTATGAVGLALAGLFSLGVGLIAASPADRRRRYLLAVPVGAAWGLSQLLLWYEWGLIAPFRSPPPWPALFGAALALVLVRHGRCWVGWLRARRPLAVAGTALSLSVVALWSGSVPVSAIAPEPVTTAAGPPVMTPERAEVLVVRTLAAERADAGATVAAVVAGVPAGQDAYPAWFVGSVTLHEAGQESRLWVRFERESTAGPWRMTAHPVDRELTPMRDSAGWLASPPAPLPTAGGAELPRRYLDRVVRAARTGADDDGSGLTFDEPATSLPAEVAAEVAAGGPPGVAGPVTVAYEPLDGQVTGEPVWLADGAVLTWFTARVRQVVANQPADCSGQSLYWSDGAPTGRFRELAHVIEVTAWGRLGADGDLVVGDRHRRSAERTGVPC